MSTLVVSPPRVSALFGALRAQQAADASIAAASAFVVAFGAKDNVPENQRGAAIIQFLFSSPTSVENVAMIIHPSLGLTVFAPEGTTVAWGEGSTVPIRSALFSTATNFKSEFTQSFGSDSGLVVGAAQKELALLSGDLAKSFNSALQGFLTANGNTILEAAPMLGALLFVKDQQSMDALAKAGSLCVATMKRFIRPYMEDTFSRGLPPQLDSFEAMILNKLEHPNQLEGMESIQFDHFAPSLTPRVLHIGNYVSNLQADERSGAILSPDVIVIRYGVKQFGESAFFARTFIVEKNAPKESIEAYEFTLAVHKKLQEELKVGAKCRDIYANVMAFAASKNSTLCNYLVKSFGFITGLLVLEARGTIGEKGLATIEPGMAFAIRVALDNAPCPSNPKKSISIEIADTCIVAAEGVDMKTKFARELDDIRYTEEDEKIDVDDEEKQQTAQRNLRDITRHGKNAISAISKEEEREEKRRRLLIDLHNEFVSAGGKNRTTEDLDVARTQIIGQLACGDLSNVSRPELNAAMLKVQRDKKIAWIPVCGAPTPFHISTINRIDFKHEGALYFMTVVFHSTQEANIAFRMNRTKVFVRDLTLTAPKEDAFAEFIRNVNDCIRDIKNIDLETKNNQGLAKSGHLKLVAGPKKLPNIKIRPAPVAGKHGVSGNLEVHENGLRFSSVLAAPLEILYSNVKHFIFQPSVNTLSTIFHVTLKQPILVGKKKTEEISFYADVMEQSESVDGPRMTYDQQVAHDAREEERVQQTNREFALFARGVEEKSNRKVEIPISSFSMDGVPHRTLTTVRASTNVMWALNDLPPFTISVTDIELVSLERVTDNGINFDINFVLKNYKPPVAITTVPRSALEMVKDWCLAARVYYTESRLNIQWTTVLKDIRDDPNWEPFGPEGWRELTEEGSDEEDAEDEDSDPSFDSSAEEDEDDDEEDDDSDSDFNFDEESDVSTDSSASGESWDDMIKKAEDSDASKSYSDSDDERPKRKARTEAPRAAPAKVPPKAAPGKFSGGKFAVPAASKAPAPKAIMKSSAPPPRRF